MISYAQNFEDVILRRVFRDRTPGFYIDVGAMDPVLESVTKAFYDEGWSGINIEPNEWFYSKLLQDRPRDINLHLALGETTESRQLHVFEQYGISTFDESGRDQYVEKGFEVQEKIVRVTTLAAVCQEYVKHEIDFLKVDCEGWEKLVLSGGDWERFRPTVVLVEATEPGSTIPAWSEWEPILTANGRYEMVYFDGLNRFYLRREYSDLRQRFCVPPNVFDGFVTYATHEARQQVELLKHEINSLAGWAADLEQASKTATAENVNLTRMLQAKEDEIQGLRAIQGERDSLLKRAADLDREIASCGGRVAELETTLVRREQELLKARLWVGQLSQDLVASKLR